VTAATDIVVLVATIMALGVLAQLVSDRLQIPSVVFLILAGVVLGPELLGVFDPEALLGVDALSAIVGISVAIIVFEGAFHLHVERLREAPRETLRLVTVGAVIALVGTAAAVRFGLGAPWSVSFLVGSLLVATGPTVITPIMNVVPVRERVASALETEGVINDVTAAILALVTFEFVVLESGTVGRLVLEFLARLGVGVLVGVAVAGVAYAIFRFVDLPGNNAVTNARLLVLVAALVSYAIAEWQFSEAGIAAVATAGFVLGNVDIPHREEVEEFKGAVSLLAIAFVFIILASLLSLDQLATLGVGGVLVVVAVMALIRPALVLLSTVGGRFTFRERIFVSAIGPRGIIPASVATLFALELERRGVGVTGDPAPATVLVGTVFLVIFTTVVLQGGFARHIAEALDVIPMRVIVVGSGRVGTALAERLEDRGEEVVLIDNNSQAVESARSKGFTVRHGDGTDAQELRTAGADNARVIAAATGDDDVNMLIGQLARNRFEAETVVARVNEPENERAFEDLDIETVPAGMSIAWSMDNFIERPGIAHWMTELDRAGDVQEIEITSDDVAGETVAELGAELPENCHLALLSRDGESRLPRPEDVLERGDHVTLIGRKDAVREAIEYCHPGP